MVVRPSILTLLAFVFIVFSFVVYVVSWRLGIQISLLTPKIFPNAIFISSIISIFLSVGFFYPRKYFFWVNLFLLLVFMVAVGLIAEIAYSINYNLAFLLLFYFVMGIVSLGILVKKDIRNLYFDKYSRWWENKKRYALNIPCSVDDDDSAILENLSETGAFIRIRNEPGHDLVNIRISVFEFRVRLKGVVVHTKLMSDGLYGFGVKFIEMEDYKLETIRDIMQNCKDIDISRAR